MPSLAKEHTKAGAAAFIAYFWEVVNYSQDTLDTSPFGALVNPTCSGCAAGVGAIDKIKSEGGSSSGGHVEASVVRSQRESTGTSRLLSMMVRLHGRPQTITYPSPRGREDHAAYTSTDRFLLSEQPMGWRVEMIEGIK